jgi:hypothetical protein
MIIKATSRDLFSVKKIKHGIGGSLNVVYTDIFLAQYLLLAIILEMVFLSPPLPHRFVFAQVSRH